MYSTILHDLAKAHISDLHRQAETDALSLAARRARQAPATKSTPFMPAHTTAELIRPGAHPARCPQALASALTAAAPWPPGRAADAEPGHLPRGRGGRFRGSGL